MRRILALAVLAALSVGSPALAVVEDTSGALTTAQAQELDRRLDALTNHRFDVLFADQAPGGAIAAAERLFTSRGLGPADGTIVVSMRDRQVGVHLGEAFADRNVGAGTIQQLINTRFSPRAREGDLVGAVASLATGLVQAGQRGGMAPQPNPVTQAPDAPGFPWWLVALPVAAGAWALMRRRGQGREAAPAERARSAGNLAGRLRALRERQNQLLEGALKLDEASRLGKFAAGATADTYAKLAQRAGGLLGQAGAFGDRLDEAETHLKAGQRDQAAAILDELEDQVLPLSSEVAAAVTGIDAMSDDDRESVEKLARGRGRIDVLKSRGVPAAHLAPLSARLAEGERLAKAEDPLAALIVAEEVLQGLDRVEGRIVTIEPAIAWAELPDQAEDLAGRLHAMSETYTTLRDRGAAIEVAPDPMLENQLATAERALTYAPVDLARAKAAMAEAQEALKGYIQHVEAESDQHAQREADRQTQQAPSSIGGWMPGPIILLNSFGSHMNHGGGYGGYSGGGGDWGGGGFSGGGSFGGGSSGGGDW